MYDERIDEGMKVCMRDHHYGLLVRSQNIVHDLLSFSSEEKVLKFTL